MSPEPAELSWPLVQASYQTLHERSLNPTNLGAWLEEWSTLECRIDSWGADLMRATCRDTTDPVARQRFQAFVREVAGPSERERAQLRKRALAHEAELPERFRWLLRLFAWSERLGRDTTQPLAETIELDADDYLKLKNRLRGRWEGKERSVVELRPPQRSKDRRVREEAWRAEREAYRQHAGEIAERYIALTDQRQRLARQAGYPDFLAYQWKELRRYAFDLDDCDRFAASVAATFQPVLAALSRKRADGLGLESLRPWDESADISRDGELRPYTSSAELLDKTQAVIGGVDAELAGVFARLRAEGNLDVEDLPNKADRTFTNTYHDRGTAYVFMRAIGTPRTVDMLIHEAAHAMHFTLMEPRLFWYREGVPIEFLEAISQLMELLSLEGMGEFYPAAQLAAVRFAKVEDILGRMLGDLTTEMFQQWVYRQDPATLSLERLNQQYAEISRRYRLDLDWRGLEAEQGTGWQSDHLMFVHPLKSIEYTYAWVVALEVYRRFKEDPEGTLAQVKAAMRLGNSVPLSELYRVLGYRFPVSQGQVAEVAAFLVHEFADVLPR